MAEIMHLSEAEAHALGVESLTRIGLTRDEASVTTDHLVDNMLCGYHFAGLPRILAMAATDDIKRLRRPVSIMKETPLSAIVDGGNHVGYIAVRRGAEVAIEKARTGGGLAVVGVANTWFSGRNAYYLELIARAGLVGIHTVGGSHMVVPPGAKKAALGTNPFAAAFPCDPDPFMFDMGTGATTWGEVLLRSYTGETFPEGIGVDRDGNPTTNASEMAEGGVLAFGGYKGFGLSLTIQALALLAGSSLKRDQVLDFGPFFIVIDPDLLIGRDKFRRELRQMLDEIKNLPRQDGVDEIRLPSERAFEERARRKVEGVILERPVYDRLRQL